MSKRFRDDDVLEYKGPIENHLAKRKQRNKGLEIVFDPKSHKEYVTGFRKRKQARRKEALGQLEKKQRQQRIEERAERRLAQRERLNLDPTTKDSSDEDGVEEGPEPQVQVFKAGGMTSVVTVQPIKVGSDSEEEGSGDDDDDVDEMPAAAEARKAEKRRQREKEAARAEAVAAAGGRTKLSKTALRIMNKTKLKIEGKKTLYGAAGAGRGPAGGKRGGRGGGRSGGGGRGGGGKGRR